VNVPFHTEGKVILAAMKLWVTLDIKLPSAPSNVFMTGSIVKGIKFESNNDWGSPATDGVPMLPEFVVKSYLSSYPATSSEPTITTTSTESPGRMSIVCGAELHAVEFNVYEPVFRKQTRGASNVRPDSVTALFESGLVKSLKTAA